MHEIASNGAAPGLSASAAARQRSQASASSLPLPGRTGAPGTVLALQRSVGNRATAGAIVAASSRQVIQRRDLGTPILTTQSPPASWQSLTRGGFFSTRGSTNPELLHIDSLLEAYRRATDVVSPVAGRYYTRRDILVRLQNVLSAWRARNNGGDRRDALDTLQAQVTAGLAAGPNPDIIDERYGVHHSGHAPVAETYRADFKRIRGLLADWPALDRHFKRLDDALRSNPTWTLVQVLGKYEEQCGFSSLNAVPLGIISAGAFLSLVASGVHLKDYGAGIKHGELTHRLQWHAIMAEATAGFTQMPHSPGWNHSPLELFQALGQPDLSQGRTDAEKSLFGLLMDNGGEGGFGGHQPDVLNAHMLGMTARWRDVENEVNRTIAPGGPDWLVLQKFIPKPKDLVALRGALIKKATKRAEGSKGTSALLGTTLATGLPEADEMNAYKDKKQLPGKKHSAYAVDIREPTGRLLTRPKPPDPLPFIEV